MDGVRSIRSRGRDDHAPRGDGDGQEQDERALRTKRRSTGTDTLFTSSVDDFIPRWSLTDTYHARPKTSRATS